jgi:peptidoglycan/LPS O-acetylase OafA/YrhL
VILYHTGLGARGGYVGVDVFFVISGYLISTLILTEIDLGVFRITNFWERRVRRILPALACMAITCLGIGWYLFVPSDLDALGRSVAYQSLLLSNVFFYRYTNYFSSADSQPLLHTWSLAVEEQFYLLFPFLLAWLARLRKKVLVALLAAIALGSLCLCIRGMQVNPTAAFYLLPYRAWELVMGALLLSMTNVWPRRKGTNEILGFAGLGLILFAAMAFDDTTRFPGYRAPVPCLGTALVIGSNSRGQTHLGKLLATRPFVFVGLISYSLYLWHWPMLVFVTYPSVEPPSLRVGLAIVASSLVLATISWKAVELPIRQRKLLASRASLFAVAASVFVSLFAVGALIHLKAGLPQRLRPEALRYLEDRNDKDFRIELTHDSAVAGMLTEIGRKDTGKPPELLVWGDSHAMALLHVLDAVCSEAGVHAVAATHSATAPLLDFQSTRPFSLREKSLSYNRAVLESVRRHHIGKVVLAAAWNTYTSDEAGFASAVRATTEALNAAGATVFIVADVPRHPFDVPKALALAVQQGRPSSQLGISRDAYHAQRARADRAFQQVTGPSVILLDPEPLLVDDHGICRVQSVAHALYFDKHHLSIHGEMLLRSLFERVVARD